MASLFHRASKTTRGGGNAAAGYNPPVPGSPIKVLLQTTIPTTADDWDIARFSLLGQFLRGQRRNDAPLFEVTMRDRDALGAPDSVLSTLDQSRFDEMWLFAVDVGNGLTAADCAGISRFRSQGCGLLLARDHMDLGSSICDLGSIGEAHHFHSRNLDPDDARRAADDTITTSISWPNFHSGANGDYQEIHPIAPLHPVLSNPHAAGGAIRFLPAHPHEGDVSAPKNQCARVIAEGTSKATRRPFNLAVAFEPGSGAGPAIAESSFHHFVDYNWDVSRGAPSFVTEPPGTGIAREPSALLDTQRYALNIALWLAGSLP
jgi:hypothetical protein